SKQRLGHALHCGRDLQVRWQKHVGNPVPKLRIGCLDGPDFLPHGRRNFSAQESGPDLRLVRGLLSVADSLDRAGPERWADHFSTYAINARDFEVGYSI